VKRVLITGFSSGIGEAIYSKLKESGYRVFGLGRERGDIRVDLQDTKRLKGEIELFLKDNGVDILINSAGVGVFRPHEELSIEKIDEVIGVNLKAPIVLTNLLLRELKRNRGHIINISSIEAIRSSKFSALYSATKSGLRAFSLSLFEELRRADVKVTNINPDITKSNFFNNLNFEPSTNSNSYIAPEEIADVVYFILNTKSVVTELTIRPQRVEIKKKSFKIKNME